MPSFSNQKPFSGYSFAPLQAENFQNSPSLHTTVLRCIFGLILNPNYVDLGADYMRKVKLTSSRVDLAREVTLGSGWLSRLVDLLF